MTEKQILRYIKQEKPTIIYIGGKTSTGKTHLALKIAKQYLFKNINLDNIIIESIIPKFSIKADKAFASIYRDREPKIYASYFIKITKKLIKKEGKKSSVVIEGSIGKPRILKEIISNNANHFAFIYIHPQKTEAYHEKIKERLKNDIFNNTKTLPKEFWHLVYMPDLEKLKENGTITKRLKNSINTYCTLSKIESETRLKSFQRTFKNVIVLDS